MGLIARIDSDRKEADMQMIGCDLHSRQQTLAILDTETGVPCPTLPRVVQRGG
jgi:hypothetical protein